MQYTWLVLYFAEALRAVVFLLLSFFTTVFYLLLLCLAILILSAYVSVLFTSSLPIPILTPLSLLFFYFLMKDVSTQLAAVPPWQLITVPHFGS